MEGGGLIWDGGAKYLQGDTEIIILKQHTSLVYRIVCVLKKIILLLWFKVDISCFILFRLIFLLKLS